MEQITAPRTHPVQVRGRCIVLQEGGNPEGPPILFLGPAPSSRLLDLDEDATAEAGVRLITVDRPGYGDSDPIPADEIPSWGALADDLAEALRSLGVRRCGVIGWSNGGIGALALAARQPGMVARVVVSGAPAPDSEVPWIPAEYRAFLDTLRDDLPGAAGALAAAMPLTPELALEGLGAGIADAQLLSEERWRTPLLAMLHEAFRQGVGGLASDIVATNLAPWGFDLALVRATCTLLYGADDEVITPEHGRWYAERLPARLPARLEVLPGVGHLAPLVRWREMLEAARG